MPKPLTVWTTINCGKFWKRMEYQTTWCASWEICRQVRKQQLELDVEQQTDISWSIVDTPKWICQAFMSKHYPITLMTQSFFLLDYQANWKFNLLLSSQRTSYYISTDLTNWTFFSYTTHMHRLVLYIPTNWVPSSIIFFVSVTIMPHSLLSEFPEDNIS